MYYTHLKCLIEMLPISTISKVSFKIRKVSNTYFFSSTCFSCIPICFGLDFSALMRDLLPAPGAEGGINLGFLE